MNAISLNDIGGNIHSIESLYSRPTIDSQDHFNLDASGVSFVKPIGIMALALAARRSAEQSDHPVRLVNLDDDLLAYLERVNFFEVAGGWLQLDGSLYDPDAELLPLTHQPAVLWPA